MPSIGQDLRFGLRMYLKHFGFTSVAVITLALGIGANAAIFSVVSAVLLRPLPYPESDQLTWVWVNNRSEGILEDLASWPNFLDWRAQNQVFSGLAGVRVQKFDITGVGEPEELIGASVSANFFELMRCSPLRGRGFSADEEQEGRDLAIVISYNLWQRRFGGDPNVVGQTIRLDGQSYNIIGIMPIGFQFPDKAELWRPLIADAHVRNNRAAFWLPVVGRLKPGVTWAQAQVEMDIIANRLEQQYPSTNTGLGINVVPMRQQLVAKFRHALLMLFGAVVCVLLAACANIMTLLLARGAARQREVAIRAALGANRWRLIRQYLTESLLLAAMGGGLGLLVAKLGVRALVALRPTDSPITESIGIDARVLLFTLGVSLVIGVVFGVFPAMQSFRLQLSDVLKEGGRSSPGSSSQRMRAGLVIAEVALALLLLLGAGLLLKSSWRLQQINPGFNTERALKVRLSLPSSKYREGADVTAFYQQLLERLNMLPGVQAAGATTSVLMRIVHPSLSVNIEGRPAPNGPPPELPIDSVSPGYFQTMLMRFVRGRDFTDRDKIDGLPVAIVNETMARHYWPNEDPIGKRFTFDDPMQQRRWVTIVGVVKDSKRQGLDMGVRAECYLPIPQRPMRAMEIVLRATDNPLVMARVVREAVWSLDRDLPVSEIETIEQMLSDQAAPRRFYLLLLGSFALVALLLAAIGIYGIVAYSVTQRTSELGLRLALGAPAREIWRSVVMQGMKLALIGLLIGLLAALAMTRLLKSLLFAVSATDPLIFIAIPLLLLAVVLLACLLPARRAAKVNPMIALRAE